MKAKINCDVLLFLTGILKSEYTKKKRLNGDEVVCARDIIHITSKAIMGNYASKRKKVGYSELRESIPGSLVSDHDFKLFYSLCRIESARTISTLLHPSSTQLFFVVISGEVEVHLTNTELKNRPILATVFRPGEVIHFFNIPLKSNSVVANIATFEMGECLQNGNIKMSLHFSNGLNSTARVIGMDRTGLNEFLITAQNNTHALRSFLELTVSELPTKSPFFKTITPDQVRSSFVQRFKDDT